MPLIFSNPATRAAVRQGHAVQNPIDRLDPALRPKAEAREAAWFEDDELPRLFEEIPDGLFRVLFETALKTGARQGELVAARWSDISLADAVLRVRRSYSGGHLSTPKTLAGRRDIHLTATPSHCWATGGANSASQKTAPSSSPVKATTT